MSKTHRTLFTLFSTLSSAPLSANLTENKLANVAAHRVIRLRATQRVLEMVNIVLNASLSFSSFSLSTYSRDMARPENANPAKTAEEVEIVFRAEV